MATKIQQILEMAPNESVLFGSWLSSQGLDARGQYAYMKSGWLDRISKGVYKIHGTEPSLPIIYLWGSLWLICLRIKAISCLRGC